MTVRASIAAPRSLPLLLPGARPGELVRARQRLCAPLEPQLAVGPPRSWLALRHAHQRNHQHHAAKPNKKSADHARAPRRRAA